MAQGARARRPELHPAQGPHARVEPALRVRGSALSEHRRVLGRLHGHLHDPRRHLHEELRLLRGLARQAGVGGSRGAGARGPRGGRARARARGHHVRQSRRPRRRGSGRLRGHRAGDPASRVGLPRRAADSGLSGQGGGAPDGDRRRPRRPQPQHGDGAAPLQDGPRTAAATSAPSSSSGARAGPPRAFSRSRASFSDWARSGRSCSRPCAISATPT